VYPITDTALAGGRSHAQIVRLLCRGGASLIQLRDKRADDAGLLAAAVEAAREAEASGARLIVNDRCDIARLSGAAGVHLGDEDLPPEEARRLLGPDAIVGVSTHGLDEALRAARLPVDYVALGPVFATAHASVDRSPLGLEAVRRASSSIDKPIVAIGGITLDNASDVLEAGAASVAVIGDLMTAPDPASRVAAYLRLRA